jgi:hypothetical protein
MLRDKTMAEVSASGSAYRDYLRFTRPAVARQMRAFGLEFEFCAAERDGIRVLPTLSAPTKGFDLFAIDSLCRCGFTPPAGRSPFQITPDSLRGSECHF